MRLGSGFRSAVNSRADSDATCICRLVRRQTALPSELDARARPSCLRETRIQLQIVLCHVLSREAPVELRANAIAIQRADPARRFDGLIFILHDEAGDAFLENLRH